MAEKRVKSWLALALNISSGELRELQADCGQEVKHLGSVPTFQKCHQRQREGKLFLNER